VTLKELFDDPTFMDLVEFRDEWLELGLKVEVFTNLKLIELRQTFKIDDFMYGGLANFMMSGLTDIADEHVRRILLTPTTKGGDTSISRMREFYKAHGFIEVTDKNKELIGMRREPLGALLELDLTL
jgi:hypothetical protein